MKNKTETLDELVNFGADMLIIQSALKFDHWYKASVSKKEEEHSNTVGDFG